MKIYKILFFLLLANAIIAQTTTAKLDKIGKDGLHKILIPASIHSFYDDFRDFKIYDNQKNEVPYSILETNSCASHSKFNDFKIVSRKSIPNASTEIIFENSMKDLQQFNLNISNTEIKKKYSISGSNNLQEWFGLVENQNLIVSEKNSDISIPKTTFKYLKLWLNDKKSLPINIEKIGNIEFISQKKPTEKINPKNLVVTNNKAEKKTIIEVDFAYLQRINTIGFDIKSPSFYSRNAQIFVYRQQKIKHKFQTIKEIIYEFELNSNLPKNYEISNLKQQKFFIEIDNQDNQPLEISAINFSHNNFYIVADLKINQNYTLSCGDQNEVISKYDLPDFSNNYDVQKSLPDAKIIEITNLKPNENQVKTESFWQKPWFLWVCVIVGGLSILFFAISLIKDLKK